MRVAAVTGAWSYLGRHVTRVLLTQGQTVRSLTSRVVPTNDPFKGAVATHALTWKLPAMTQALQGVDTLYNTFWVRHTRPPIGHRGPWTSHAEAVAKSHILIDAACAAGVQRVVHISITNPRANSHLPYFQGKAEVEAYIKRSGLSYAILRPSCFFGANDILINNIAYAVRRFPVFFLPNPAGYRIRPMHVGDMATSMCTFGAGTDSVVRDACGPEQFPFAKLVQHMGIWLTGQAPRVMHVPIYLCQGIYQAAGQVMRDTILSRDELDGLASDLLGSDEPPLGTTLLSQWVQEHKNSLGSRFRPEPRR